MKKLSSLTQSTHTHTHEHTLIYDLVNIANYCLTMEKSKKTKAKNSTIESDEMETSNEPLHDNPNEEEEKDDSDQNEDESMNEDDDDEDDTSEDNEDDDESDDSENENPSKKTKLMDEESYLKQLNELEQAIAVTPLPYVQYEQAIALSRAQGHMSKCRELREKMCEIFPLGESKQKH